MTTQLLNDRYQIIRTLGSGGFGDTFLAEDTYMPSRRLCVVKCLRPIHANPQINQLVQERFQREAAILEALGNGHRQIPTLYAYFYNQTDQQFYLVQEWVDGHTLSDLIHQYGQLSDDKVREILIALLPVFDYVHSQGIIHRDVKPPNIILRRSDQLPVLIDFGAVRETMGVELNAQGRSTQSIVIGTPGYMPSEQSVGRPVFSSDLYSLGMTAIYLLTGKQPQDFASNPHTSDILWQSDAPATSPKLVDILNKAISFNPGDRYQTAGELLAILQDGIKSAANQVITPLPITVAGDLPATIKMPESAIPKSKLSLIGVGVFLISALLAAVFLRPQESKVAITSPPSASPLSTAIPSSSSSSVANPTSLEPRQNTPIAGGRTPILESKTSITSSASEPVAMPTNNMVSSKKNDIKPSCNYYAGDAVTGQAVNVDLCSITTNNSNQVGFVYYLGEQRMGSAANCVNNTWTTFSDQQIHHPLSAATQRMLENICSRRQTGSSKFTASSSQAVTATIFAPPTNIRESPDGKILCVINRKTTITTYAINNSWYQTDVCGEMGVVQAKQIKF